MKQFEIRQFSVPQLQGISETTIAEHLKLYAGYVKNANLILNTLNEKQLGNLNPDLTTYAQAELRRRLSFEYNGIRNHEIYFESLIGGPQEITSGSKLYMAITQEFGSYEAFTENLMNLALTRGIGWAMLSYDKQDERLLLSWVDEQHLGQLQGCPIILALDMWEHSYVADYLPSGKKNYATDYLKNLNWNVLEKRFDSILGK